jgi:Transglycosylase SLT domain
VTPARWPSGANVSWEGDDWFERQTALGSEDGTGRLGSEDGTWSLGSEDETWSLGSEDETWSLGSEDGTGSLGGEDGTVSLASRGAATRRPRGHAVVVLGGAAAVALALTLGLAGLAGTIGGAGDVTVGGAEETASYDVSARARAEIPPEYLRLYLQAANRYGLDWAILAGIGKVECDHGRDPDPSCTHEGAVNAAGAGGPAQFLAATWREYGVNAEGEGPPDRWNPADAIFGMANYLRARGAPEHYRVAIYAYNHAWWYVAEVERWAAIYRGAAVAQIPTLAEGARGTQQGAPASGAEGTILPGMVGRSTAPVELVPGSRAVLDPGDGHVALVPEAAPPVVQAMVMAGNELQDLPYGPAGHPDPLGALSEDCSSTVNYVLYRAAVRSLAEIVRENPLAQDYVNWGLPGPGRWVTIYATTEPTDHVFIVIAGLRLDTSHNGTDVGPNREQDGPRWRILDHIPTWAHWSVRHPPGL